MKVYIKSDNIYLPSLKIGTKLRFFTKNSEYNIEKIAESNIFLLNGGSYFPKDSKVAIQGTTFGSSMIRSQQLAQGIVEIRWNGKTITTSWCEKVELLDEK